MSKYLEPISRQIAAYAADDLDVVMQIRYVGSQASCLIAVDASTGDISSTVGAAGAEAADANFTIGSTPGTIDVSNTAADTLAEVVDFINGLADYEAYLVGGLRADDSDVAGRMLVLSATQAKTAAGLGLLRDTSTALNITLPIRFKNAFTNDDEEATAVLQQVISKNTFGSGTSTIQVYEIDPVAKSDTLVRSQAGGATTVEQTITLAASSEGGLQTSRPGRYLLVRLVGSAACTGYLDVKGYAAKP